MAAARRLRAPLLDLQRRTQEQAQRVVAARAANAAATKSEKTGLSDLLKALGQTQVLLERLSEAAEASRSCQKQHQAEAAVIWAQHGPQEEREEKRLKV